MVELTCGGCKYWQKNPQCPADHQMLTMDRRPCGLAQDALERARYFHKSSKACNRHSVERPEAYKRG